LNPKRTDSARKKGTTRGKKTGGQRNKKGSPILFGDGLQGKGGPRRRKKKKKGRGAATFFRIRAVEEEKNKKRSFPLEKRQEPTSLPKRGRTKMLEEKAIYLGKKRIQGLQSG